MRCERVQEWLPAWVDGALSPRRMRRVAAHLAGCPACRAARDETAAALAAFDEAGAALLPALGREDLDAAFERVETRLEAGPPRALWAQPRPAPARPRWLDWRVLVPAGGLAAAAAAVALTLGGPDGPGGGPGDGADTAPVELAVARDLELLEDLELVRLLDAVATAPGDIEALAAVEGIEDLDVVLALDELLAEEGSDEG